MRILKSKRGMEAYDIIYWTVRILFVLLMLFFIYFLARTYESKTLDTTQQESELFVRYMLYNPNALPYVDPTTGRAYPGVIDLNKLNAQNLEEAMSFSSNKDMVAANITLFDSSKTAIIASSYYNQERYENWLPISTPVFFGEGAVNKTDSIRYVVYREGKPAEYRPGYIKFEVLVPKS